MVESDPVPNALHVRAHTSILARVEKRVLIWIAQRLPLSLNSDHVSALTRSSMIAAGISCASLGLTPWAAPAAILSLATNWFGDSLDGTLARVRGHERPRYGFYVDHVIDLAGTTALICGLAYSGVMNPLLA